ncbi:bifunctional DNA primase/polymerase [Roseovarius sp. C7]|uniref:bifunctional DNA primase/polymerase n=1 Tax=Roseovarius sp. C7 TaxID=3398643 RepID=UPI0039F6D6E4
MNTPYGTTIQNNLSAALALAMDGIAVFPVSTRKRPLVKGWQDKATPDPDQIKAWWAKWPDAMPALQTGKRNGVMVLDVDRKNGKDGFAELAALGLDVDTLSDTQSATAGDGRHLYFVWSEGMGNSAAGLPPGLDVRGEGGFVVAPGAANGNGVYKLLKGSLTGKLPPWPEALPIRRRATEPGDAQPTGLPWPVFVEAVRAVPNDIKDRETWVARIAAIHAESGGGSDDSNWPTNGPPSTIPMTRLRLTGSGRPSSGPMGRPAGASSLKPSAGAGPIATLPNCGGPRPWPSWTMRGPIKRWARSTVSRLKCSGRH